MSEGGADRTSRRPCPRSRRAAWGAEHRPAPPRGRWRVRRHARSRRPRHRRPRPARRCPRRRSQALLPPRPLHPPPRRRLRPRRRPRLHERHLGRRRPRDRRGPRGRRRRGPPRLHRRPRRRLRQPRRPRGRARLLRHGGRPLDARPPRHARSRRQLAHRRPPPRRDRHRQGAPRPPPPRRSPRAKKPIVSLNCGAIPRDLVEGTLFGHERGAFTGAAATQRGVFEEASGGTVLLDEIGELPLAAQAALRRVLETGRIQRVGSPREIDVDVRIVAATHRDLLAMSKRGLFREDLYFRIAAVTLDVPPLRDRTDEIPALVERFIRVANERHRRSVKAVSDDAMARLLAHDWPGNVRELRNAVERAVVVACDSTLGLPDLPPSLLLQPAPQSTPPPRDSAPSSAPDTEGALPERVGRFERDLIVRALHDASGNKAEAARKLGIPVRTLAYRIKVLGIDEGKPT
ncbi:MAG: sigma-54 dependent transcriptional regulator [Polyangiaceae bacterium]